MRSVLSTGTASPPVTLPPHQHVELAVRREAPALLAYLSRRVQDPAEAADLLGDVLLVIWRRVDKMPTEPAPARMWMFGVARNVLLGSRRSVRRRDALTARLRHELTTTGSTAGLDGTMLTRSPEDPGAERVAGAIATLSAADREILRLVHWDSFSLDEVAEHLRLRPSATRSRYHRARNRLRQILEALEPT